MIELKLSQGANRAMAVSYLSIKLPKKLPKSGVSRDHDCISPAKHSSFSTPIEMMHFLQKLRTLSGGKPVGFKLCIGQPWQFMSIVKAMLETKLFPTLLLWMVLKVVLVQHQLSLVTILVPHYERAYALSIILLSVQD